MPSTTTIRRIQVVYSSEGADKVRSDAMAVASAQDRMGQAVQASATVTEQASRRQLSAASAYDKLRQATDASYKAQVQFDRAQRTIDRATNQGIINASERVAAIDAARNRFMPKAPFENDNDPVRRGLSNYDRQFIQYQGFDVASSLGSGASPLTVAFQQGPQVLQQLADRDGGLRAGLKELGVSALGLVTPFTVAATAVTGIGAAFAAAAVSASREQEALQKATQGIGAATGATAGQLDMLARANAEAGKVSTSAAREIAAGFASTGQVALPVIGDLISRTSEYARITGQEVPAATAELARMFSDPAKGADDLAAKIGGLDDRTRQLIQTQQEQGERSAAQETLAAALKAQIDANTAATTGWAAAWNTVSGAADRAWESLKRAAGAATGIAPESAAAAVDRLNQRIESANRIRAGIGAQPLGLGDSLVAQRDAAAVIADTERRQAEARAAEERANRASRAAGDIARQVDPNTSRLSELRQQQSTLRDALADPLARGRLADFGQTEQAYDAVTRAISSMTDAEGRAIGQAEMSRRADQLRLDALKATTDAEKAAVAERQKSFDLIGKTITGADARGQIERAGILERAGSSSKSGGSGRGEALDEFDRATKSVEDRIRRQQQEAATFGAGAEAVARYRVQTDLLTAAKRAERDVTPELTAQIQGYAQRAAEAAATQERLRESMRTMDDIRAGGRDVLGGIISDLGHGTTAATTFANALGKIGDRLSSLAAESITDTLFGKRGSSDSGILGGLLGSAMNFSPIPKFANGGIMTAGGPVPLRAYAGGGIANSPQLALYGEGRMPEAYVPLPDGKRIPVAMAGPSNTSSTTVRGGDSYFDLRGSTLTEEQVRAAMAQAIAANNAEVARNLPALMEEARYNGALAH